MLEKFISSLLVPYLSKYVENIDEKQLRISLWRGKVTLHDLVLKASVLDEVLAQMDAKQRHRSTVKPLPISIHRGLCRTVNLHIPIFRISSQPIVLEVDEVLLTIRGAMVKHNDGDGDGEDEDEIPYKSSKWDDAAVQKEKELAKFEQRREEEQRRANLSDQSAEAEAARRAAKKQAGYFTRLAERILNNIIVKVHTVHVRYEDIETNTVLGAVLSGIQLLTIDERTGQPGFTNPNELPCLFKRLEMTGLQLYCDDAMRMLGCKSTNSCWFTKLEEWQAWYNAMRHRVREGNVGLSTVFGPVSGRVDLHMVFKKYVSQYLTTPYMRVDITLDHMMLRLTRSQYVTIMQAVSKFTNFRGKVRPVAIRPTVPVKGNAKVWWTYILKIVFTVVNEPREQRLLARVSEVFIDEYVTLYRAMVHKVALTPAQEKAYNFLIRYMTVPAMIQGRMRVYDELAEELRLQREEQAKEHEAEATGQPTTKNNATAKKVKKLGGVVQHYFGWLSWLRGPFAGTTLPPRQELLESLAKDYGVDVTTSSSSGDFGSADEGPTLPTEVMSGTDPTAPTGLFESPDLPPSYQWLCVVFTQPMLSARVDLSAKESLTLRTQQLQSSFNIFNKANSCQFHLCVRNLTLSNPGLRPLKGLDMQHLVEGINVNALVRDGGIATNSSILGPLRAAARGKKQNEENEEEAAGFFIKTPPQRSILTTTDNGAAVASVEAMKETPLLDITGAFNPFKQPLPDTQVDVALRVRMLPLRLVLDLVSVYNAVKFFELPAEADVSKLTLSTRTAASAVGSAATQGMQTALSTAKGFYLSIEVYAPILILPRTLRRSKRETALVVSLGRVLLEGHPMSNAEKARRQRLLAQDTSEELHYYRHHIAFNHLFMELTTIEDALLHPRTGFMIVPEITLGADLLQLIDSSDATRERLIVRLDIPQLRAALSLHQLYLLLRMVESGVKYTAASQAADKAAKAKLQAEEEARQRAELTQTQNTPTTNTVTSGRMGREGTVAQAEERVVAAFQQQQQRPATRSNSATNQPGSNAPRPSAVANNTTRAVSNASVVPNATFAAAAVGPNSQVHEALVGRPPPDRPLVRLELSVAQLGVYLVEDNDNDNIQDGRRNSNTNSHAVAVNVPAVRKPQRRPRFALTVADVDFVLATRTMLQRMLLHTSSLGLTDTSDPARPILSMAAIRIDIARSLVEYVPVEVAIRIRTGTAIRLGTPFLALTEELVDMMHLLQYTVQACTTTLSTGHDPASPTLAQLPESVAAVVRGADDGTEEKKKADLSENNEAGFTENSHSREEEEHNNTGNAAIQQDEYNSRRRRRAVTKQELVLASQLKQIAADNAKVDRRESNLTLHLEGTLVLSFLNRGSHDHRDHELAAITVHDLEYFLEKNTVTLSMGANLREVAVRMAERVGLATAYRAVLHRVSRTNQIHTSAATTMHDNITETITRSGTVQSQMQQKSDLPPHVTFTFRSEKPVMPIFREVDEGQRVLVNANELHYTNHIEFGLESSVAILDLFTVMLLKTYFSSGFFSRVFRVGQRALYNGQSILPSQAGPRLLTGMRFVFKDVALVVPAAPQQQSTVNTLKNDMAYFMLTTSSVVMANKLQLGYAVDELSIVPRGVEMGRGVGDMYDFTRRITHNPFGLAVVVSSPLDQRARQPSKVDIIIRDLKWTVDSNDALVLSAAIRRNLMHTEVKKTDTVRTPSRPVHAIQADSPTEYTSPITSTNTIEAPQHHRGHHTSDSEAFLPAIEPPSERSVQSDNSSSDERTQQNTNPPAVRTRAQRNAASGALLTIVPPSAPTEGPHSASYNNNTTSTSSSSSSSVKNEDDDRPQIITLNISRLSVDFADAETNASQFRIRLARLVMRRRTPENAMLLQWCRFDFIDTRDEDAMAQNNTTTTDNDGLNRTAHKRLARAQEESEGVIMAQCDHGLIRLLTTGMTESALFAHFGERVPLMSHVEQLAVLEATYQHQKAAQVVTTTTGEVNMMHNESPMAASTSASSSTITTSHSGSPREDHTHNPIQDTYTNTALVPVTSNSKELVSAFADTAAQAPIEVTLMTVDVTLRRLAVTDQWLGVYDFVLNEKMARAWGTLCDTCGDSTVEEVKAAGREGGNIKKKATTTTTTTTGPVNNTREAVKAKTEAVLLTNITPTSSSSSSSSSASSRRSAIRCVINTPQIAIPLLDNRRNTLCEFRAASFLADFISLDNTTSVGLRLGELSVVDARSGYPFVLTRAVTSPVLQQQNINNEADVQGENNRRGQSDITGQGNTVSDATRCVPTQQLHEGVRGNEPHGATTEGQCPVDTSDETGMSAMVHTPDQASVALAARNSESSTNNNNNNDVEESDDSDKGSDALEAAHETDAVHVIFTTLPAERRNRIVIHLGLVDVLIAMPIIYGLVDYGTSPVQPIARLTNLGIMHEQRRRLAATEDVVPNSTATLVELRLHEPRIVLVGDARDLSKRRHDIIFLLGRIHARLENEPRAELLRVHLSMRDFAIVDYSAVTSLKVNYTQHHTPFEELTVNMQPLICRLGPPQLERLIWVLRHNLLLPRTVHYYGNLMAHGPRPAFSEKEIAAERASNLMPAQASSPTERVAAKAAHVAEEAQQQNTTNATTNTKKDTKEDIPPPVVSLSIGGIWVEIRDAHDHRTHSARIAAIEGKLHGKSELRVVVPLISIVEHFHDRALLAIGTASSEESNASRASRPVSQTPAVAVVRRRRGHACYVGTNATAAEAVMRCAALLPGALIDVDVRAATSTSSSSSSSSLISKGRMNAIVLTYNVASQHAKVKVAPITVLVAPRGAGTLINLFLSLRVPPPCEMTACPFANKDNRPLRMREHESNTIAQVNTQVPAEPTTTDNHANNHNRANTVNRGSVLFRATSESDSLLEASWTPQSLTNAPVSQRMELIVTSCDVQLAQHGHNIALANIGSLYAAMTTYKDGGSLMQLAVRSLVVRDSSSTQTRYPVIMTTTQNTKTSTTLDEIALQAAGAMPTQLTSAAELPSAGLDAADSNSHTDGEKFGEGFVEVYLYTEPPLPEATQERLFHESRHSREPALMPRHSKRLRVHVGQLTVTAIPAVLEEMVHAGQSLQHYISLGSRTRAQKYVAHCCVATVRHHTEQLTQMNIRIEQPTFLLVEEPMSTKGGITMRPGELIIRSYLIAGGAEPHVVHESAPRLPRKVLYSDSFTHLRRGASYEVIRILLRQLSATMLDKEAFRKKGDVDVMYIRTLPPPYSATNFYNNYDYHHHEHNEQPVNTTLEGMMNSAAEEEVASHMTTPLSIALGEGEAANELSLAASGPTADILISITSMKLRLTRAQTDFLLLVAGAFIRSADADEEALQPVKPTRTNANNNNNNNTNEAAGNTTTTTAHANASASTHTASTSTNSNLHNGCTCGCATAAGDNTTNNNPLAQAPSAKYAEEEGDTTTNANILNSPVYGGPCGAAACANANQRNNNKNGPDHVAMRVRCTIDEVLLIELADLFRITCRGLQMIGLYDPMAGSRMLMQLDQLAMQHVGIYVLTRSSNPTSAQSSTSVRPNNIAATTRVERVNELVDMVRLRHMRLACESGPEQVHEAYLSSVVECHMRCDIGRLKLAMSPTSLFDMREVLYLPFVSTILQIPTDPICMLNLTEAVTVLERDVVLDNKHVVLTTNRLRCCYKLDLNRHRLIFSGDPSGQLVLSEGCELTISNGTIVIPGMYTVDSFVSFGAAATLYTTPDCCIDKRYLDTHRMNTRRRALATARQAAPPAPLIRVKAIKGTQTQTQTQQQITNRGVGEQEETVPAAALITNTTNDEPLIRLPGVDGLCPISEANIPVTIVTPEPSTSGANNNTTLAAVEAGSHSASECEFGDQCGIHGHPLQLTLTEAARVEEAAAAAARVRNVGTILVERRVQIRGGMTCKELILQTYSEEIADLTSSLRMGAEIEFAQDTDNGTASRRNVELRLTRLRSGPHEEHLFLPTDLKLSLSGTESVSLTIEMEAVMISTRVALLRSLVEVAKDFQAAFVEELTVKRRTPLAQFEDDHFEPLYSVAAAGRCGRCGRRGAYLAYAPDRPGSLCYHCCTGKYRLPAVDFAVDIPLVDCIFLGSRGDFAHLYIRNVHAGVDSGMQVDMSVRACLYNLSNAAAVWEPLIENVEVVLTGSVHAHAYRIRIDRAELVLTPMHLRVLTSMAADYGDATPLQPQLRRRFRLHARRRVREAFNGMRMYVNDLDVAGRPRQLALDIEEEEADKARAKLAAALREEEHLLLHDDEMNNLNRSGLGAQAEALRLPPTPLTDMYDATGNEVPCVFDLIDTERHKQQQPQSQEQQRVEVNEQHDTRNRHTSKAKMYAKVEVENFCNRVLLVDGHTVEALGGRSDFVTPRRNIVVRRQKPIAGTAQEGYVTSLATPPLYVRGTGMLLRSRVEVKRNAAARRLDRLVQLCALPLHRSNTVLRIHNRLRCPIEVMEPNGPRVQPDEYYYLSSVADLDGPLYVKPLDESNEGSPFGPATTLSRTSVTLNQVLYGQPLELMCETTTTMDNITGEYASTAPVNIGVQRRRLKLYVVVRQDDMRGGVPIYGIAIQPRYLVDNKLPYPVRIHGLACTKSSCSREDLIDVCHSTLFSSEGIIVRSMCTAPLMIGMACLNEVAFCLQVPQRSTSCHELYVSAPTCFCETRLLTLLANNEREMLIRVVVSEEGIMLTTPFAIANHTQLKLTIHECDSAGMIKRPWRSTNYMALDPCPLRAVPASPHSGEQNRFFVNVYTEGCSAICIPFHVQQRGLIVLEEGGPSESPKTKSKFRLLSVHKSKTALASVAAATAAAVDPARGKIIHLAYLTKTDASGTLLVTITPRWVVVNRTPWPIFVAPSRYAGANAREAAAAAIAEQQSRRAKRAAKEGAALPEDDVYAASDALRRMLEQANDITDYYLSDPLAAISIGPGMALPFYDTPRMPPEIGYNVHVLLDPHAPLYSTPIHLETIYTEKIIAYVPRKGENDSSTSSDEEEEGNETNGVGNNNKKASDARNTATNGNNRTFQEAQSPPAAEDALPSDAAHAACDPDARAKAASLLHDEEEALFDLCHSLDPPRPTVTVDEANQPQWSELDVEQIRRDEKAKAAKKEARRARRRNRRQTSAAELPDTIQKGGRHRYLEVNLTARDSYTFVIVEYPPEVPFIVLNRLDTAIVVLDPSRKTAGRIMAHVEPGCGAELLLDVTVTTQMQVVQLVGSVEEQRERLEYEQEQLRQQSTINDPQRPRVLFDVSRPMTAREKDQAPFGLQYRLNFGDRGERLVEIFYANPCICIDKTITACPPTPLNVLVNILTTTISVVQPNADLLFAMICDIRLNWKRKERRETWQLSVMHFQVDNQTEIAPRYPACVLSLRPSPESAAVVAYLERTLNPGKMILEIKEARLDVKPIAVRVTDTLLLSMMQFAVDVRGGDKIEAQKTHVYRGCLPAGCLYEMAPIQADIMAMHVLLENLIINPMIVRFWLTRDENGRDFFKESMPGRMAVVLSIMVSSIDDVQVATPGIVALRREGRLAVILQWLTELYMDSLLAQIRGIVLQYASSLPFIGAPLQLASGIGSGAVRLFAAPIDGLTTSPAAFAQGLASGTVGFAQAVVGGGLGAFANLTETGSRVLGKGAGITERQRQRQGFLSGLKHGITGVVERPREAMATSGRAGAMVGAAQGIVGVVANPLSGLLNDLSRGTNHLAGLVSDNYIPTTRRMRPIRVFHANGGVAPANALVAVYHYERLDPEHHVWSGTALISSKDGPEWYPMPARYITYGSHNRPVPATSWILDRFDANFFGWAFSRYYYGCFTYCVTSRARVRRRRWTALVKPLPYSPMAAYLGISPGRELAPRETVQRLLHPQPTVAQGVLPTMTQGTAAQALLPNSTGGNDGRATQQRLQTATVPPTLAINPLDTANVTSNVRNAPETEDVMLTMQSSIPFYTQPGVLDAYSPNEALQRREQRAQLWHGATEASPQGNAQNEAAEASVYWSRASAGPEACNNNVNSANAATDLHRLESSASVTSPLSSPVSSNDNADNVTDEVDARLQRGRRQEQALIASTSAATFGGAGALVQAGHNADYVQERGQPGITNMAFATNPYTLLGDEPLSPTDSRARPPRPLRFDALKMPIDVPARRTRGNRRNHKAEQAHQQQDAAEAKQLLERRAQPPPHQLQQQRRQVTPVDLYEYSKVDSLSGQTVGSGASATWGQTSLVTNNGGGNNTAAVVWQDVHGRAVPEPQAIRNPVGWDWLDEWKVVTPPPGANADAEGWTVVPFDPTLRRRHWQRRLIKRLAMELPSMDAQEL